MDPCDPGDVRHLAFGDRGHAKCTMGPKQLLEGVLFVFSLKSPCLKGFQRHVLSLASNVTQVAVICGWNDSYESMGPRGHVRHPDLVMGAMPGTQWAKKRLLERVFLA